MSGLLVGCDPGRGRPAGRHSGLRPDRLALSGGAHHLRPRADQLHDALDEPLDLPAGDRVPRPCFRGIDTLTAMTLVTELHDIRRFTSARALMAYIGLVPLRR